MTTSYGTVREEITSGSTINITELDAQSASQVVVTHTDADGVETTLALTTDYTINQAVTEVTLLVALDTDELAVATLSVPEVQDVDLKRREAPPTVTIESALDKLTLIAKTHRDIIDRAVVFSEGVGPTGLKLPDPVGNEGLYIKLNADGDAFEYGAETTDLGTIIPTDGVFVVGNGTTFIGESGNTARASLGLSTADSPTFAGLTVSTNLVIPSSATPSVTTAGDIALDTTVTDYTGLVKYHDGVEELTIVAMPTANLTTTNGHVVMYNSTTDEFYMATAPGAGSGMTNVADDTNPQLGGQLDINGYSIGDGTLELLKFSETASAVNELTVTNAATGGGPILSATGDDANIDLNIQAKGTGVFNFKATSTASSAIRLFEDTDNGTNYVGLKAGTSLSASTTFVLPTADGTADQVMKTDGSGNLGWATSTSTGDWEPIDTATASASAIVDFTGFTSTYIAYMIVLSDIAPATDNTILYARFSDDAGVSFEADAGDYHWSNDSPGGYSDVSASSTQIQMVNSVYGMGNASGESLCATVVIYNPTHTASTNITWNGAYVAYTGSLLPLRGAGRIVSTASIEGIRFLMSSGNIASGEFRLYGLRSA